MCWWHLETSALNNPDICRDPVSKLDLNNVSEGQLLYGDYEEESTKFEVKYFSCSRNGEFELHLGLHSDLFTVPPGNSVLWDKVLESFHDLC